MKEQDLLLLDNYEDILVRLSGLKIPTNQKKLWENIIYDRATDNFGFLFRDSNEKLRNKIIGKVDYMFPKIKTENYSVLYALEKKPLKMFHWEKDSETLKHPQKNSDIGSNSDEKVFEKDYSENKEKMVNNENISDSINKSDLNIYYGELGEDVLLRQFLNIDESYNGFYVDIGAYHPDKISNTKWFYERGWNGMNIDPNPTSIKMFNEKRPLDININIGVSDETSELNFYYMGEENGANTFDKERYETVYKPRGIEAEILEIKVDTLNNILSKHLPKNQHIDFIDIDAEEMELKILKAFDFEKYGPDYILVEDLSYYDKNKDFMDLKESELYKLLNTNNYIVVGKTWYSILFKKKNFGFEL